MGEFEQKHVLFTFTESHGTVEFDGTFEDFDIYVEPKLDAREFPSTTLRRVASCEISVDAEFNESLMNELCSATSKDTKDYKIEFTLERQKRKHKKKRINKKWRKKYGIERYHTTIPSAKLENVRGNRLVFEI